MIWTMLLLRIAAAVLSAISKHSKTALSIQECRFKNPFFLFFLPRTRGARIRGEEPRLEVVGDSLARVDHLQAQPRGAAARDDGGGDIDTAGARVAQRVREEVDEHHDEPAGRAAGEALSRQPLG